MDRFEILIYKMTGVTISHIKLWIFIYCLLLTSKTVAANQPPRFILDQSENLLRLKEGPETPVGNRIYTLKGEDPEGDHLHFGVRGQVANELIEIRSVNSTTADVYLLKELDRETQDDYQLILTLTDGHRGNLIEQSMQILVLDINDNQPIFKPYNSTLHIKEGSPPGIIDTLEATDLDEGSFGQVVYHLLETDGNSGNFKIETVQGKGVLSFVRELDFEEKYLYQLQVLAVDRPNAGRRNTGTAAVVVKVEDIEDQPPEFLRVPSVTKVPEDLSPGSRILQVWAADGDRGINNAIHYSIVDGDNDLFGIEPDTGWVFVRNKLDREIGDRNGAYILKIQAQEVGSLVTPTPTAETEVTILLTDINDETPTFKSKSYVGEISENAQLNVPITFLGNSRPEVYDYDQGKNGTFILSLEGDRGIFEITPDEVINEATFLIRVKNHTVLDYEQMQMLQFKVIAREIVKVNPKSSTADITVHIRDANDNIPEFELASYTAHVREDVDSGASVVKIIATDQDSGEFGTSGIRFTDIKGQIANKLHLDPISGLITVKSGGNEFDREQISTYFLTVVARDNLGRGNRNTVQLQVIIDDVNDNAPQFLQNRYETRIDENESNFPYPFYVEAFDRDLEGTLNNDIRFHIVDGDPKRNFSMHEVSGEIIISSPLDFEAMNGSEDYRYFNLTVQARDLGQPSLHSNVSVIIYVQDKNDHSPIFSETFYNASVREDIRPGDPIIQVHAFDHDGSLTNRRIVYRIKSGAQDKLIIQAEEGLISVAQGASLDPDLTNPKILFHLLKIAAIDGGIGIEQKQAVVQVNISVLDVNNKVPELQEPEIAMVKENSPPGTLVVRLIASDRDNNPDLRFTLDATKCEARNEDGALVRLMPKDYAGSFEVAFDGQVKIQGKLDRELVEMIKLRVSVEDRNAVGLRQIASGTLTIKVEDENDNDPVFQKLYYRRAVPENSKPGTSILTVTADDKDVNRTLLYHLQGPDTIIRLVSLDPNTGELVVRNKMDREQFSWLNFTVKATDNGIPPRSGFTNVSVQVLDENDNNPVFTEDIYAYLVPEDAPVGTQIAVIQATDADAGDYAKVTYLLDKKSAKGKFSINPRTGALTIAEPLDREDRDRYMLVVEAWDNYELGFSTGESRNAFKQISLTVTDKNDHSPTLVKLSQCVSVTEFHNIKEVITLIKAKDEDDPKTPNAHVDFSIEKGNDRGLFSIESVDHLTARLLAIKSLKQQIGNHTLTITLKDRGEPPLYNSEDITICVTDFNDHAPRFIKPLQNHTIRIAEDLPVGTAIMHVEAIDDDVGLNGEVRFALLNDKRGDSKTFEIDEVTGLLTLKRPLDRERQKKYEVRVEAHDLGVPTPLASDMDIHFYVKNVIDVEPEFNDHEAFIAFMENVEPGEEIVLLPETVDSEEYELDSEKAIVCYFIVGGHDGDADFFHVDPIKHEIFTISILDREVQDTYQIIIKATKNCDAEYPRTDHFNEKDKTTLKLVVRVKDDNDNAPFFIKDMFTGGMTTDTTFGAIILSAQAIDLDIGLNSKLTYYILGDIQSTLPDEYRNVGPSPFLINHTSGEILLNFYPQKPMKGYFDFDVLVNDTDGLEDKATVRIYLVREDQKLQFTMRLTPEEFRPRVDEFQLILSNTTNAIVNIDSYKYHENKDGSVDRTKIDVLAHFVQSDDNSVMSIETVTRLLDKNIINLNTLFQDYNVIEGKPAVMPEESGPEELLIAWLIGSTACLAILLIFSISFCVAQRSRYRRQLKAATVIAFGSQESTLNRAEVPNTNQHSIEGSNPIWMHSYENEWYKEEDSLSTGSEASGNNNSLDENVINDTDENSQSSTARPQDYPISEAHDVHAKINNYRPSSCHNISKKQHKDSDCQDAMCIKQQNDLNKLGLHRHNIYESLGINGNAILSHIETTEL